MTIPLRYATAGQEIPLGYFLDSTDGDTEETGLTIANTDIKLWKHGHTTLTDKNSGGATHISNGVYYCVLDATDSNTKGGLVVFVHKAGALSVKVNCFVYSQNIYDTMCSTDVLKCDLWQIGGVEQSATDLKDFTDTGYDPATHKVQGVVLTDTCTTNTDVRGTDSAALADTALTNATWTDARAGALTDWINGGRLDLILDIIAVDTTTDIPAKLLAYVQLLARSDAAIATDNATELTAINADGGSGGGDFSNQAEALEAIRDRGDSAWTTGAGGSDRLLMVDTTIATLASQTSFTLTAGSADDDAYNNCTIVIEDASTATQKAVGIISDYTGGSKTVTLKYDPAIFTMATTDKVYILAENALKASLANRQLNVAADGDIAGNIDGSVASVVGHTPQTGNSFVIVNHADYGNAKLVRSTTPANKLDVSATGEAGLDFANIKNATGPHTLTNITVPTVSILTGHTAQTGDNFARLGAPVGASISADVANVKTDTTAILIDTSTTLNDMIERILGISQENFYIDSTVFTGANMTSCRIRIYSVAGSVGTASDVIATYTMTTTYAGDNLASYKMVKA